jgi:D-alanyl-D-alanine carboxypeptidase
MAPSKLGLKPGTSISVDDAIRALVTKSANDVAATIGENLAKSESAFAVRMTSTAHALGMSRTTFKNASGLPNPAQVTTARDMATLSLRIQRDFPQYYPYFRIMSFTYKGQTIRTHNRLLGRYDGADGIKTGYIGASGYNLTSSAKRGDKRVVGVVMGARSGASRNAYMMAMLDRAFPKCVKGKAIAALAGSSKGAIDPLGVSGTEKSKKPKSILAALAAKKDEPEQPAADAAAAAPDDAQQANADSADEDAAEAGTEAQGNAFKTVTAEAPAASGEPTVIEAKIGTPPAGEKLPFAVKPEARQPEVDQTATIAVEEGWKVQIGNYSNKQDALASLMNLKKKQPTMLKDKMAFTVTIQEGEQTSYRGRFTGFTESDAKKFCGKMARQKLDCETLPPQS